MNRLHIFGMMALAVAGLTSCEADDDPKIQTPTEFVLNTPPFADQLYELQSGHVIEFTCSQPNYGLTLAPSYSIEVSLYDDFGASLPQPEEGDEEATPYSVSILPLNPNSATIQIEDAALCEAILAMRGITDEASYTQAVSTVYVRAHAAINGQAVTSIANTNGNVVLKQVQDYSVFADAKIQMLYTPGNANGWNQGASMKLAGYGDKEGKDYIKYRGLAYLNGEFKFTNQPDWNGINYGFASEGNLSTDGGAGNLPLPAEGAGLYWIDVNVKDLTYTTTYVSSFAVIGDLNGWNADAPLELTPDADYKIWTYTGTFTGGGFKFIVNGPTSGWNINYGGPLEDLTFDGANIQDTAGEHTVTVDLSNLPYTATFE